MRKNELAKIDVEILENTIRIALEPGMVARFEGGSVMVGEVEIARVVVHNAGPGFNLRAVVEPTGAARLPLIVRGSLSDVAKWIARHPEAMASRPDGRIGDPRWATGSRGYYPLAERIPALTVRQRDAATGQKIWVEVEPSYVRRHPHYRSLAGPVGNLP